MWFNISSLNAVLINKPTTGWEANYNIHIEAPDGHMEARFYDINSTRYQINTHAGTIEINKWYHVAFRNDASNNSITLLIRDEDYATIFEESLTYPTETIPATSETNLTIGADVNGYIDEVRISNVVRDYTIRNEYDWETSSSDYFDFYFTNSDLITSDLVVSLEGKFDDLDYTILQEWDNINLLDRSQKLKIYLYDFDQPFASAQGDIRDWDVGVTTYATKMNYI